MSTLQRLRVLETCVTIILTIFTLVSLGLFINRNKEIYLTKYDPIAAQTKYINSQWVKGWYATTQMSDAELYSIAGYQAIKGNDPTSVDQYKPPFAKYFIGLSIVLFGNPVIVSLAWGLLLLFSTYLLSRSVLSSWRLAILPSVLLSFDLLFRDNLLSPMLDLPYAFFLTLSVYFFIKAMNNSRFIIFSGILLGLSAASKVFLLSFVLCGVGSFYFLFKKKIKRALIFGTSTPIVYLLSYIIYFKYHNNLTDFAYLHYWVIWFSRNIVPNYPPLQIWRLLINGVWLSWKPHPPEVWFDLIPVKISEYTLWWTLGLTTMLSSVINLVKERKLAPVGICLSVVLVYLSFWSFAPPYPRYLLTVLPFIFIILVFEAKRLVTAVSKKCLDGPE